MAQLHAGDDGVDLFLFGDNALPQFDRIGFFGRSSVRTSLRVELRLARGGELGRGDAVVDLAHEVRDRGAYLAERQGEGVGIRRVELDAVQDLRGRPASLGELSLIHI